MHGPITAARLPRRSLMLAVLVAALVAAALANAGTAAAAYKAKVENGTLKVAGDGASDTLVLRLGTPPALELDVGADGTADFTFDRTTFTAIDVAAGGGDDLVRVDPTGGAFPEEALTIDGGDGADTLLGSVGAETFLGGKGNDFAQGGDGNDRVLLGDGDDTARWNPGDDSDTIEGQNGTDLLDFFGANIGEKIGISANGARVGFTRDIAGISMDLDGVDRVAFHAFGGADTITVDSLAGTDTKTVAVDLSASIGGGGDTLADVVEVRGTGGADRVTFGSAASDLIVSGLAALVQVAGGEAALDSVNVATLGGADSFTTAAGLTASLIVNADGGDDADSARYNGTPDADTIQIAANGTAVATAALGSTFVSTTTESLMVLGLGGGDTISGVGDLASLTALTIDGGDGNDVLLGGNGPDLLLAGRGEDFVDGNQGSDSALLGDGNDLFEWDPGDASDTVDGQAGSDVLDFFGSNIGETIAVVANGRRTRLTRDIGNVTMDFGTVEGLAVHARGGADLLFVDDLSGTGVTAADVDLAAADGSGDTLADMIVANGTSKRDVVSIDRSGSDVVASGLPAQLRISGGEGALDTLLLQTLAGDDDVTVTPTVLDLIAPVVNLGGDE